MVIPVEELLHTVRGSMFFGDLIEPDVPVGLQTYPGVVFYPRMLEGAFSLAVDRAGAELGYAATFVLPALCTRVQEPVVRL